MTTDIIQKDWILDRQHETGALFWRCNSSRVKFRCEVDILEFVREPEELKFMSMREFEHNSNPLAVVFTCVFAIIVTVFFPWIMMNVNGIQ